MSLTARLSLTYTLVSLGWSLAAVVALSASTRTGGPAALVAVLTTVMFGWVLSMSKVKRALVRGANARLRTAFARGDTAGARRELAGILACAPRTPRNVAAARIAEATLAGAEGNHAEASRLLEAVDPAPLTSLQRALLLHNIANARGLEGRADDALRAAEEARDACPPHADARTRSRILSTLGIARVRAGQFDAGVAMLRELTAAPAAPRDRAARAYFLGEGLLAMGQVLEARNAWSESAHAAPSTDWSRRAAARLAMQASTPFR
jgi:hypothetical protein